MTWLARIVICSVAAVGSCAGQFAPGLSTTAAGSGGAMVPQQLAQMFDYSPVEPPPANGARPVAEVFIRPAGAANLLPATVTESTLGSNYSSVVFVVPAGIPYGSAQVLWRVGGGPFKVEIVTVIRSAFGLLPGIRTLSADGSMKSTGLASPARPGQTIVLTGTGLGYGNEVKATVAGAPATVIYAGHGPTAGYDTVQVQVPAGTAAGCYVPVEIAVGESRASSLISVSADGSPCVHPLSLGLAELNTLDAGGFVEVAAVSLSSRLTVTQESTAYREDSARVNVTSYPDSSLGAMFAPVSSGCQEAPQFDFATIVTRSGDFSAFSQSAGPFGDSMILRNGATSYELKVGSGGTDYSATFPNARDSALTASTPPAIGPGTWTLSWFPSPFFFTSVQFAVPGPVRMAGGAVLPLRRDRDQTITWNGNAFGPSASMSLWVTGKARDGFGSRALICTAPAGSGSIAVPVALMDGFAAGSLGSIAGTVRVTTATTPAGSVNALTGDRIFFVVSLDSSDSRVAEFQ